MMDKETLSEQLSDLRAEHRALDDQIGHILVAGSFSNIDVQRLKKRKLAIKDQMLRLESALHPNIIA
ncbi:MAG: hypothetical protein CMM50_13755 [Rhodospirillaceae bacterium]|nr:hypothetical protein [Rhodospirillaceae bacterium]|tara:strand:- start:180 stop:380 length:201 start_codon:yes stop_codon:yes gene_type:complete